MDGTFVSELAQRIVGPKTVRAGKMEYLLRPGKEGWEATGLAAPEPIPDTIGFSTLDGLVGYIRENEDGLPSSLLCVVQGPTEVALFGPLHGEFAQRFTYARAECVPPQAPRLIGTFMDHESFVIGVQTLMVDTPERAALLKFVGNIRQEHVRDDADDGVSQKVVVRKGAASLEATAVPNPVMLAPYRTFPEVEQPASPFVLRLKQGPEGGRPSLALFEADGGKWQLEAVKRVRTYLSIMEVPVLA